MKFQNILMAQQGSILPSGSLLTGSCLQAPAFLVSFSAFIRLILRNRWVSFEDELRSPTFLPVPPLSSFLPVHLKDLVATDTHCRWGWGGRGRLTEEGEKEGDRDGLISTSSTFSSKPTVQRPGRTRQDPACPRPGSAACLRAGLPPGGGGPQYRQAAPQTKHLGRRKEKVCGVGSAHMLQRVFCTRSQSNCKNSANQPEVTIIVIN